MNERKMLEQALLAMKRIYQAGYDRIIDAGGTCDTPDYMMTGDPTALEIRALLAAPDSTPCAKSQVEPDAELCRFYEVTNYPGLVRELVGHVAQLQDSAKRNVKPWEDTFPPTLLPAYIERVNAENESTQTQGEPVAWTEVDVLDFMSVALRHADYSGLATSDILDGLRYMAEKGKPAHVRAEQPAPVAVVLPERVAKKTHNSHDWDEGHADGWKAYDEELKRLNPSL